MQLEKVKAHLQMLLTEAEKLQADLANHKLDWAIWQSSNQNGTPPDWLLNKDDELVVPFEHLATSIYLSTICYLDALGLHEYLMQFYQKFGKKFDASNAASQYDIDHYWSGQPYNVFLVKINQFLLPLDVLRDSDRYLKLSGIQYLETILENTASIVHKSGKVPTSEPEVYKAVRSVLEAIFPTAKSPKANFIKTAQEYKPDILIPELSAAVEYKYATDVVKMKSCIAQIADDVKGYSGDNDYNIFYAVFYVKGDIFGKKKFEATWKEKKFPKNWRAFYIVGS